MSVEMTDLNKAGDESKINRAVTWKTGKEYNPLNYAQSDAHGAAQKKKMLCASRAPGTGQRNGNE